MHCSMKVHEDLIHVFTHVCLRALCFRKHNKRQVVRVAFSMRYVRLITNDVIFQFWLFRTIIVHFQFCEARASALCKSKSAGREPQHFLKALLVFRCCETAIATEHKAFLEIPSKVLIAVDVRWKTQPFEECSVCQQMFDHFVVFYSGGHQGFSYSVSSISLWLVDVRWNKAQAIFQRFFSICSGFRKGTFPHRYWLCAPLAADFRSLINLRL